LLVLGGMRMSVLGGGRVLVCSAKNCEEFSVWSSVGGTSGWVFWNCEALLAAWDVDAAAWSWERMGSWYVVKSCGLEVFVERDLEDEGLCNRNGLTARAVDDMLVAVLFGIESNMHFIMRPQMRHILLVKLLKQLSVRVCTAAGDPGTRRVFVVSVV
jgi:hypothetical protein